MLEVGFIIAIVLVGVYAVIRVYEWWNNQKQEETERYPIMGIEGQIGTKDLFLETVTMMGSQYEFLDDYIVVDYQGYKFAVIANNYIPDIQIWDTYREHVDLHDIDEFSRLRKAVNEANRACSVTTFYVIDEGSKTVNVHSKSVILFIPQIPDLAGYLRVELNEFFRAHQLIESEMANQRNKENA